MQRTRSNTWFYETRGARLDLKYKGGKGVRNFSKIFITLPIHLIMGGVSLFFFFVTLHSLTHSGVVMASLALFIANILGYLLLSLLFLKNKSFTEVTSSTVLFLGIGLLIWVVFLQTGFLDNLFFIYHISGYSSFMWYVYAFNDRNERLLVELGILYSVIPSLLILFGYYLSKLVKTKNALMRVAVYMGNIILAIIIVFMSGYNGERIETRKELANAFPMHTGFPFNFAELKHPTIDPPLPWNYGGFDCCSLSIVSWSNFWMSVSLVFMFLLLLSEGMFWLHRKSNDKTSTVTDIT